MCLSDVEGDCLSIQISILDFAVTQLVLCMQFSAIIKKRQTFLLALSSVIQIILLGNPKGRLIYARLFWEVSLGNEGSVVQAGPLGVLIVE